jgi:sugar transferase (PEP-CTERM/EpsH1 system associated)
MKVMFLAHRAPWPADRGDRIRSARWLEALAGDHEVFVGAFAEGGPGGCGAPPAGLRDVFLARRPTRILGPLSLLAGRSLSESFFRSGELRRWVRDTARSVRPDVAVGFSSSMAQYLFDLPCPRVLDLVDADSEKWRAYAGRLRPRWLYRREARLVRALEERILAAFDHVTVVAGPEADVFPGLARPEVLGNGVDAAYFRGTDASAGRGVVMTGVMDYPPNVEGAAWFARHVLPIVRRSEPETGFTVVGANPAAKVRRLAGLPGVKVTGRVEDVRPWLWGAAVAVAPMPMGRGVPNKILQAMAAGRPVVGTPHSVAGLPPRVAAAARTAAEAPAFAAEVVRFLREPVARVEAGEAARRIVAGECRWEPVVVRMREIVSEVGQRR